MNLSELSDDDLLACIKTEMRLVRELPNHCDHKESLAILECYRQEFPALYRRAQAELRGGIEPAA